MPKIQTPEMRPNPMKTGLAASSHHHFYPHKSAKTHFKERRAALTRWTQMLLDAERGVSKVVAINTGTA